MHYAIAGFNAWSLVFLTAALIGAVVGASWHTGIGLVASIFAALTHSAVFALFIGGAKTLKETVRVYRLEQGFIDRTNVIYFRLFPWAIAAAAAVVVSAVLGGLAERSALLAWVHGAAAIGTYLFNLAAAVAEYRELKRLHNLLAEMSAAVPVEEERAMEARGGASPPPAAGSPSPVRDPRARGRAILTLSVLGLVTLIGYRVLAGIPDVVVLVAGVALAACVCLGIYLMARGPARPAPPAPPA